MPELCNVDGEMTLDPVTKSSPSLSGLVRSALVLALLSGLVAGEAAAGDLGFFEARRVQKQADEALGRGDAENAAELYGRLIEGLDRTHKKRGDALYGASLAALGRGDGAGAEKHLGELLAAFPRHERSPEARILRGLAGSSTAGAGEEAAEEPPADSSSTSEADPADRVRQLEARVARLETELRQARMEVEKKEEAIEKLKQLVVGENG